jgi:hypothetical protein
LFRSAIVDLQVAVCEEARQRVPLVQREAYSSGGWTLRQNLVADFEQILVELLRNL